MFVAKAGSHIACLPRLLRGFHSTSTPLAALGLIGVCANGQRAAKPPLLPSDVRTIIAAGHHVQVEKSLTAMLPGAYESAGAEVVERIDAARDVAVGIDPAAVLQRVRDAGASSWATTFLSHFRFATRNKTACAPFHGVPSATARPAQLIDIASLPGNFAVTNGPIMTCLAMQIGAKSMSDGLARLGAICRAKGMHGRADTHQRSPGKVLRKIKRGRSIIIAVAGDTGAAMGAASVLNERFAVHWITPGDLAARAAAISHSPKIYACWLKPEDYLVGPFGDYDPALFQKSPHLFKSDFFRKIEPFVTMFCDASHGGQLQAQVTSSRPSPTDKLSVIRETSPRPTMLLALNVEKGAAITSPVTSIASSAPPCEPDRIRPMRPIADRLYFNKRSRQQRTFTLHDLSDFFPLDLLEQHSRMLTPHLIRLLHDSARHTTCIIDRSGVGEQRWSRAKITTARKTISPSAIAFSQVQTPQVPKSTSPESRARSHRLTASCLIVLATVSWAIAMTPDVPIFPTDAGPSATLTTAPPKAAFAGVRKERPNFSREDCFGEPAVTPTRMDRGMMHALVLAE